MNNPAGLFALLPWFFVAAVALYIASKTTPSVKHSDVKQVFFVGIGAIGFGLMIGVLRNNPLDVLLLNDAASFRAEHIVTGEVTVHSHSFISIASSYVKTRLGWLAIVLTATGYGFVLGAILLKLRRLCSVA